MSAQILKDKRVTVTLESGKIRVKPDASEMLAPGFVAFPRSMRKLGSSFLCDLTPVSLSSGAVSHYVASNIRSAPAAAQAPKATRIAPAARPVLTPDEIIEDGMDCTHAPDSGARYVYSATARGKRDHSRDLMKAAAEHSERLEEWGAFVRETFCRLVFPETPPTENRSAWAVEALEVLEQQQAWGNLVQACSVSRLVAANATVTLVAAVGEALGIDDIPENTPEGRDPRGLEANADALEEMVGPNSGSDSLRQQARDARHMRAALLAIDAKARLGLVRVVASAAAEAAAQANAVELARGAGFSRDGASSAEEMAPKLLEALRDPRLARILQWAGRFNDSADAALAKAGGRTSVVGITNTGDVNMLTGYSRSMLAAPGVLGTMGLSALLDHGAQGIEAKDEQPRALGDLAVLVDVSASMSGEREERARGLAIAALVAGMKARRRVSMCLFSGEGDTKLEVVLPGHLDRLEATIRMLSAPSDGGGTDVDGAIRRVLTSVARLRDPDFVVLTDGYFPPIANKVLAEIGDARLFGVFLDASGAGSHPEFDAGWDLSSNLTEEEAAKVINAMRAPRSKRRAPRAVQPEPDNELPF